MSPVDPGALAARDLAAFWHPCSHAPDLRAQPPLEVVAARGCRITLADGTTLLDGIASWWCKSLGHGHPRLRAALEDQLGRFEHVIAANTTHEPLVRLCERLLAAANGLPAARWGPGAPAGKPPGHFGRVFLAGDGSTGVEVALKMALQAQAQRGAPGRTRFAAFTNGYHGETIATLAVGDCGLYGDPYRPLMFDVPKLGPLPDRTGPADPRWMDARAEWRLLEPSLEALAPSLAAIVYEPVLQGAGGMRLFSPALLRELAAWARARGVYLVADEIAAGFGRLGAMLASHLAAPDDPAAALPDFAVLSKGLTGGFLPLSAVLTTDAVFDLFDAPADARRSFLHSNTYTANALGVAVANASLDVYADEAICAKVRGDEPRLRAGLEALAAGRPFVTGVRAAGLVGAVDLRSRDGGALDPAARTGLRVAAAARARGALLRPLGDTMYLFPPLTIAPAELDELLAILGASVDAVLAGG